MTLAIDNDADKYPVVTENTDSAIKISMQRYWLKRYRDELRESRINPPKPKQFTARSEALERIFGAGGIKLNLQGTTQFTSGVRISKNHNPALPLGARTTTSLLFQNQIQATASASIGDRLRFGLSYNTNATFDFDAKALKLAYEGNEDDIVKSIEAGNVSLVTGSSLIRGGSSLMGIKTKLQFGRLTATAIAAQRNTESRKVAMRGGVQTASFHLLADQYDQNRHFFLGHFFRKNFDSWMQQAPLDISGIRITRIEVWITNRTNNYSGSRNIFAFADLGEDEVLTNDFWKASLPSFSPTSNLANNLLPIMREQFPDSRCIDKTSVAMEPLRAYGITGGYDYEKVESARLLSQEEYVLNPSLGYISLRTPIASDQVLAVAFEYTFQGQTYKVGEFSSDIANPEDALYVKMLRNATVNPKLPIWKLMMKNIYPLGGIQMKDENFSLQIKYLSDTAGISLPYLPIEDLNHTPLIRILGLDRLDANKNANPDGFFDYLPGYTVQPDLGLLILPSEQPFGSFLEKAINNPSRVKDITYKELYDSTIVVAREFTHKNKFVIEGEYQASSASQLRLGAMNIPEGSVMVTAGGNLLKENSDYVVDYALGIVTIINTEIANSGQDINVTLENQSAFTTRRRTILGLDLQYEVSPSLTIGGTFLHFGEKLLSQKINIGEENANNSMIGFNLNYNKDFMWLTNLLNRIPTVNATAPSRINFTAEYAKLMPKHVKSGSFDGTSIIDDFEYSQTGIDLRAPQSWQLASTPAERTSEALFPEGILSNDVDYGKNRALLNWYSIDRLFTLRNSTMAPGYLRSDLDQLSNHYIREINHREIFPGRELAYGESSVIHTLNLSFYPSERGPYNLDAENIDAEGELLNPEKRWGGIMRRLDNTNFEQANIGYIQFWLLSPFLEPYQNSTGGDLYLNLGDISEDILKDGFKSYENGIPADGSNQYLKETVWGRVSTQKSLTYSFEDASSARKSQDVGLDGLSNSNEFSFSSYSQYVSRLQEKLSPSAINRMKADPFSPLNDPAGDNYHFYLGEDYTENRLGILERYKRYNGLEGNSLSSEDASYRLHQSAKNTPDVEDINQDNTLNEYERYYQYRVSLRPQDLEVGKNFITDKQTSWITLANGERSEAVWYQFKIPIAEYDKAIGGIAGFSSIKFVRLFLTAFNQPVHLRFASLELVRGEWRIYEYSLNGDLDKQSEASMDISVVNVEENSHREPVNYLLPPGATRLTNPSQSQIIQLNEQSMSLDVKNLNPEEAVGTYKNTSLDLRNYGRIQMWVHAESPINDSHNLQDGDAALFIRFGSDLKANYYEYEVPLKLTPHGYYEDNLQGRNLVWPSSNFINFGTNALTDLKLKRNKTKRDGQSDVSFSIPYSSVDPENTDNQISVIGNPSLSDVRTMSIGIRNKSATSKDIIVWVNELRATDYKDEGAWAANVAMNLQMSDLITLYTGAHIETSGFGSIDQNLNSRRTDNISQYNFSIRTNLGHFLPDGAKLEAPIYYSFASEKSSPKYNPWEQDITLKESLSSSSSRHEKDSINSLANTKSVSHNFSLSSMKFDVRSQNPMPWDPANFIINVSYSKQTLYSPEILYENAHSFRGSLQYFYSPAIKAFAPLKTLKSNKPNMRFFKNWELRWLPNSIAFSSSISRDYFEQQARSGPSQTSTLPISVNKNFLWDRKFQINWNLTNSLALSFASNTLARIEEPLGAINKKLFPDRHKEWRDTIWSSILSLGTPWAYNQTFTASYRAPFAMIPVLNFINANASYIATYRWDRGTSINGISSGNSIVNQSVFTTDMRLNFGTLYRKIPKLRNDSHLKRLIKSAQNAIFRYRSTRQFSIPLFLPEVGDILGQGTGFGPLSPGLDFAFGFADISYLNKALERDWLIVNENISSPAIFTKASEMNLETNFEPIRGLKIQLIFNRMASHSQSIQFMHQGMPQTLYGSYSRTHCALLSALKTPRASNGYTSAAFSSFLDAIPIIQQRIHQKYASLKYPSAGFLANTIYSGEYFSPIIGESNPASGDVLIPAFIAAYTGQNPESVNLSPFPSFSSALPNWRIAFDLLSSIPILRHTFSAISLNHAYQCTYSIASYSSHLNWVKAQDDMGFIPSEETGYPIPSSPFIIPSVTITENFAPLIGIASALPNGVQANAEWRVRRALTLNPNSGQIVEAHSHTLTIGAGYKIADLHSSIRIKGKQKNLAHELSLRADLSFGFSQAIIRRIYANYAQPTSGSRNFGLEFTASYVFSRKLSIAAFITHQAFIPLITSFSYPSSVSTYGLTFNLNLTR